MRILIVTDSYPPFIGGADLQTQKLGQELKCRGHDICIATPWQPGLAEQQDDNGVRVHRIKAFTARVSWFRKDPRQRHHPPVPDPGTVWGLRHLLRQFQPDLVHSYGWITYSSATALIGMNIPLLVTARDYGNICAVRSLLHYQGRICDGPSLGKCLDCAVHHYTNDDANNATFGRSDAQITLAHRVRGGAKGLIAVGGIYGGKLLLRRKIRGLHSVSTFVEKTILRYLFGSTRGPRIGSAGTYTVIPNFLTESASSSRDQNFLDRLPREPYILFVGSLLPYKGLWPLLEAYERLASPPPLVLIGSVSHNSPREFPPGVTVLQNAPHHSVMLAWERCLFGVVPSVCAETFGNVVLEAMSKAKPVVGSAVGGIVDLIADGETGFLVPPGDVGALAKAMQQLIDDVDLCRRLGVAGQARANRFTADDVVPRFEALYQEIVLREPALGHRRGIN